MICNSFFGYFNVMKKPRLAILIILFAVISIIISQYYKPPETIELKRDIIFLKDGKSIITDLANEGDAFFYYEIGNDVRILLKRNVDRIEKGGYKEIIYTKNIVRITIDKYLDKINQKLEEHNINIDSPRYWEKLYYENKLIIITLFSSILLMICILFFIRKKVIGIKTEDIVDNKTEDNNLINEKLFFSDTQNLTHTSIENENIISFFLKIYKRQIGAPKEAQSNIKEISSNSSRSKCIYELSVKKDDRWESRRMTIGPIGEGSGSKSKCFYVIFDSYIVIKIPPNPINDFDEYIKSINRDKQIAQKLSPKECIIPNVSVILEKVNTLNDSSYMPQEMLEEKYIKWLTTTISFQKYLKIGESFAYFMDLSKYFFLGNILDEYHDVKTNIFNEIKAHHDIIWDIDAFSDRYGNENEQISDNIQNIFHEFESKIQSFITAAGISSSVYNYKIKEWYLYFLSGKKIKSAGKDISEEKTDDLNNVILKVETKYANEIKAYRNMIQAFVGEISYGQSKTVLINISINLIELLTWLTNKGISIRDIKPDNLIVAGDPEKYPDFLQSWSQFKIGLIDVETAVDFKPLEKQPPNQPQLGGTPIYATPSHLLTNELLTDIFEDLPRALNLQDWYAIAALIYEVITGKILFKKTGALLPLIMLKIKKARDKNKSMSTVIEDISKVFWWNAQEELRKGLDKNKKRLKSSDIIIPDNAISFLRDEILTEKLRIDDMIKQYISSQTLFKGSKNHQKLQKASLKDIRRLKAIWEKGEKVPKSTKKEKTQVIEFLYIMEQIIGQAEHLANIKAAIDNNNPKLTAYDLVLFIFNTVFNFMYHKQWGILFSGHIYNFKLKDPKKTYDATI